MHLPSGATVKEFIAFAASLASLLLAIVAIFYSFVSNRDFSLNLAKFGGSSERTEAAARNVLQTTERLNALFESVRTDFKEIQPAVAAVSDQVAEVQSILESGSVPSTESVDVDAGPKENTLSASTNGGVVALYLLLKAAEKRKFFDIRQVFPHDSAWQGYCAGYLGAIEALGALEIEILSDSGQFAVKSTGRLDVEAVRAFIDSRDGAEKARAQMEQIDNYFEETKNTDPDKVEEN